MEMLRGIISKHMKTCCDLYNADATIFEDVSYNIAFVGLSQMAMQPNAKFRVIIDNNEIVGWYIATVDKALLSGKSELTQQYYYSKFTGKKAVEAVRVAHADMVEIATRLKIQRVTSHSSHYDKTNTLCRILAKEGWMVEGYAAQYRTIHY